MRGAVRSIRRPLDRVRTVLGGEPGVVHMVEGLLEQHPEMMGGLLKTPAACSTGPGTPIPIARTSFGSSPCSWRSPESMVFARFRTGFGPSWMSAVSPRCATMPLPRVVSATSMEVAPRSTAATSPAERGMPSKFERLPPSDSARPSSASRPKSTRLLTSAETFVRLEPRASASRPLETGCAAACV